MSQSEIRPIPCWESDSIPAYVSNLSPEQHRYKELEIEDGLRLLQVDYSNDCITFKIVHRRLYDGVEYEAVSYVWGNSTRTHTLLLEDHTIMLLTSSVAIALPYLACCCKTQYLWIDQICVNQANTAERNVEVPKMGDIYRNAIRVIAWLGPELSDTKLVREIMEKSGQIPNVPSSTYYNRLDSRLIRDLALLLSVQSGQDSYLNAFSRFMNNSWWGRTWCFQEAVLPKQLTVLVGEVELPHIEGLSIAGIILATRPDKLEEYKMVSDSRGFRVLTYIIFQRRQIHLRNSPRPFYEVVSRMSGISQATDPHDTVYGFIGLRTNPNIKIQADYSQPIESTFIEFTRAIIEGTRSLDIFNAMRPIQSGNYVLPTWVPDWSMDENEVTRRTWDHNPLNTFDAAGGRGHNHVNSPDNPLLMRIRGCFITNLMFIEQKREPLHSNSVGALERVINNISLRVRLNEIESRFPRITGLSRERVLEVLLMECVESIEPVRPSTSEVLEWYDLICSDEEYNEIHKRPKESYISKLDELSRTAERKRLFCTGEMTLGLAPSIANVNDKVAIIHGSRMPLILRPTDALGEYTLVGRCYLENAMRGEACIWLEEEAEEFILV